MEESRVCTKCKEPKLINQFYKDKKTKDGYSCWCKACTTAKQKRYYQANREKVLEYQRQYGAKNRAKLSGYMQQYRLANRERLVEYDRKRGRELKAKIIEEYGGKCACCGEAHFAFLTIDHINNDGAEHRRQGVGHGKSFYQWLIRNDFPKDNFQLLCMNCNFAKGHYGVCPHQEDAL